MKPFPPLTSKLNYVLSNSKEPQHIQGNIDYIYKCVKELYAHGWSYTEVLDFSGEFGKYQRTFLNTINYVYTRDDVDNPFGPWISFRYEYPLIIMDYCKDVLNDKTLASMITALHSLHLSQLYISEESLEKEIEAVTKKANKERLIEFKNCDYIFRFDQPNDFYGMCGFTDDTFDKTISILLEVGVKFYIQKIKIKTYSQVESYKSRLWIAFNRSLLDNMKVYYKDNREKYRSLINGIDIFNEHGVDILETDKKMCRWNGNDIQQHYKTFLNTQKRNTGYNFYEMKLKLNTKHLPLEKLLGEYEFRALYNPHPFIQHPPIKTNPLIRLYKTKNHIYAACQLKLFNYHLILLSLYGTTLSKDRKHKDYIRYQIGKNYHIPNLKEERIKKAIVNIRIKFLTTGLDQKTKPVSCPANPHELGRHFEQIRKVIPIVKEISNTGIKINISKAIEKKAEIDKRLNNLPDEEILEIEFDNNDPLNPKYGLQTKKESLEKKSKYLQSLIGSAKSLRNNGESLVYGLFSSHMTKTHRMNCRQLNLQGIPNEIKDAGIFCARKGHILISGDISGQDFIVCANFSKRIIDTSNSITIGFEDEDEIKQILSSILENPKNLYGKSFPVDRIASEISYTMRSYEFDLLFKEEYDNKREIIISQYDKIRSIVKTVLYCFLFGGSVLTKVRQLGRKICRITAGNVEQFMNKGSTETDLRLNRRLRTFENLKSIKHLDNKLKLLMDMYGRYINNTPKLYRFIQNIDDLIMQYKTLEKLANYQEQQMKDDYPGIFHIFNLLEQYAGLHPDNLTFPSLLGWQTIINKDNPQQPKDLSTKSRSYVIQSSGAEFIRQWIIELSKYPSIKIVNAIHDQIVIESPKEDLEQSANVLLQTAKAAATAVGLHPETMRIKEIKITDDKGSVKELEVKDNKVEIDNSNNIKGLQGNIIILVP